MKELHINAQLDREIQNTRILMAIVLAVVLVGGVIISLLLSISDKDQQIKELSNNRIMYGILSSDGRYFESVKDIPSRIVKNFSTSFTLDWANFTPETVEENRGSASQKFSIKYRKEIDRKSSRATRKIISSDFSQQFIPKTYKVLKNPDNNRMLDVEITGVRRQWQNGNAMGKPKGYEVTYSLSIIKSPPTASAPEGLEIVKLLEPIQKYDNSRSN